MSELNISEDLEKKLGRDVYSQLDVLSEQKTALDRMLEDDKCSDELKAIISQKMVKLVELFEEINRVANARHSSLESKADVIKSEVEEFDFVAFLEELIAEREKTSTILKTKAREIAKSAKENIAERVSGIKSFFEGNIEVATEKLKEVKQSTKNLRQRLSKAEGDFWKGDYDPENYSYEVDAEDGAEEPYYEEVEDELEDAKATQKFTRDTKNESRESDLDDGAEELNFWEDDYDPENYSYEVDAEDGAEEAYYETDLEDDLADAKAAQEFANKNKALTVSKDRPRGFFRTLAKMFKDRKSSDKKMGFFATLKAKYKKEKEKEEPKDNLDDLLEEQKIIEAERNNSRKTVKALKAQKKETEKQVGEAGMQWLTDFRGEVDEVTSLLSQEEITAERFSNFISKFENFAGKYVENFAYWKAEIDVAMAKLLSERMSQKAKKFREKYDISDEDFEKIEEDKAEALVEMNHRRKEYREAKKNENELDKHAYMSEKIGRRLIKFSSKRQLKEAKKKYKYIKEQLKEVKQERETYYKKWKEAGKRYAKYNANYTNKLMNAEHHANKRDKKLNSDLDR